MILFNKRSKRLKREDVNQHPPHSPVATGVFGGRSPSKQNSKPPKLKYKTL